MNTSPNGLALLKHLIVANNQVVPVNTKELHNG